MRFSFSLLTNIIFLLLMLSQDGKSIHHNETSRNKPQPFHIHHIPGLSEAQAFCSVDDDPK